MGRLVQPTRTIEVPAGGGLEGPAGRATRTEIVSGDAFTERLVKYIPAEVIGAYLSLENLLDLKTVVSKQKLALTESVTQLSGPGAGSGPLAGPVAPGDLMTLYGPKLPLFAFVLGVICTPLYIWQQGRASNSPWATHAVVATLAFCVWAYAMGSSFFLQNFGQLTSLYNPQVAAAGLVAFSLVSGAVKPAETA
jgi:hypothetical protein